MIKKGTAAAMILVVAILAVTSADTVTFSNYRRTTAVQMGS